MKKIYFIRHAKAENFSQGVSDYERSVKKKGFKDIDTIGSYLALQGIYPDVIFSSCALCAQESTLYLAERLSFTGPKYFLEELYYAPCEDIINIIMSEDDSVDVMFIIGHNPQLNELVNSFSQEHISKIPTMGVIALEFDIDSWSELEENRGNLNFFIYPKQFKYYIPNQIRTKLVI
jgi:phosphohistidine phosphatase